jgi:hypothetical protein
MQFLKNHFKNIPGWKTNKKLVAFAVDDYGNIRLHSKESKEKLQFAGISLNSRFDFFDSLDTRTDYEQLFDVLKSVKDKQGNSSIFTTYALSSNLNFEESIKKGEYVAENLDITYQRLATEYKDYEGAYQLIKEGIQNKLIKPQFHGREHLNLNVFNALLHESDPILLINLKNNSLAGLPNHKSFPNVKYNQAFAFWKEEEIISHKRIISDGLKRFENIYGYKSLTFTPPAQQLHFDLFDYSEKQGIIGIDKERNANRHLGNGKYKKEKNILGEKKHNNLTSIVRNCVFEPNVPNVNWVDFTFRQIEAAFFWDKPAIISSHRVNFCGHIDQNNRKEGLLALKRLLQKIVRRWPDVEFISVDTLVNIMNKND